MSTHNDLRKFVPHIMTGIRLFREAVEACRAGAPTRAAFENARDQFRQSADHNARKWLALSNEWIDYVHRGAVGTEPKDSPHSHWMRGIWSLNSAMSAGNMNEHDRELECFERAREHFAVSKHPDAGAKVVLCDSMIARLRTTFGVRPRT